MNERTHDAWPLGFLGMLVAVTLAEIWVDEHARQWAHTIVLDWSETGWAASRVAAGCDLLCFGDSLVKFGVLPRVIEERTGRPGYNLALLNGPPPASYVLLKRALDHGAWPSVVVADFDAGRMGADPRSSHYNYPWPELLTTREAFTLARRTNEPSFFAKIVAARMVPSVRRRYELRAAVLARLNGYVAPLERLGTAFGPKSAFGRNRRVNRGAVINVPRLGTITPHPETPSGAIHPVNARYLHDFLALCRGRGIAVVWLLPPVSPRQQAIHDGSPGETRYVNFARRVAARNPHVTLVDGRRAGFPDTVYIDHVHLDANGATALSRSLGSLLVRGPALATTANLRAVDLPRFRKPARTGRAEEDLRASEIAVLSSK
jgi:hypothetical protein